MRATMHSACGASAYTHPDEYPTRPLDESGLLVSDHGSPPSQTWSQRIDDLLALRHLEDDWDGQGAEAPHPALVDGAITLAQSIQAKGKVAADRVIAGVNGTIIFEWHSPAGYVEIEVTAPDQAEVRWIRKGSDVAEVFALSRRA
jgi:hypothetical protein